MNKEELVNELMKVFSDVELKYHPAKYKMEKLIDKFVKAQLNEREEKRMKHLLLMKGGSESVA